MPINFDPYGKWFDARENSRIGFLRRLDDDRQTIAWFIGVVVVIGTFCVQIPFHGINWVHALCSYGCIPIGGIVGLAINAAIDKYVAREFIEKWDKLFYERSGTTPALLAAQAEMIRLTNSVEFMGLPVEEQRRIADAVNRRHGLDSP